MSSCPNVTITRAKVEERPNVEERKQSIYDPSTITDEMLTNLFTDADVATEQYKALYLGTDPVIPYKSARDKSTSLKYFAEDNQPFGSKIGVVKDGQEARFLTIAISHLTSAQNSEADLARDNLNGAQLDAVTTTDPDTGVSTIQTGYSNMARTIGRDILKTKGYRLVPKNREGLDSAIATEIKYGEAAIKLLEDRGLLTINENGSIVNRGFNKENPKNSRDVRYSKDKVITSVKTIILKPILHTGEDLSTAQLEENYRAMSKVAATKNLINPSNTSNPFTEAQEVNQNQQDLKMDENSTETLETVQKSPLKITGFAKKVLTELYDQVVTKNSNTSTKNSLLALAQYVNDTGASPLLFGTIDREALEELMMGDPTGLEQSFGRSLAKVLPFSRLFDNWDNVQDEVFYTFQTAVQNRAHLIQQTLDYQGDAFFARAVLGSPEVQTLNDDQVLYNLAYIVDETGMSFDELLKEGTNPDLDRYIKYVQDQEANGASSLGIMMNLAKDLEGGMTLGKKPFRSAWEAMNYIQGIADIREGLYSGKPVQTHFMPKPDATASGALITALQASRYEGKAADVVKALMEGDLDGKAFTDMYELATRQLDKELKNYEKSKGKDTGDALGAAKAAKVYSRVTKIIDEKTGVIPGYRDLIKLPFTKFIYGQSKDNNALEISKEIVGLMIDSNNVALMTDMLPKGVDLPATTKARRALLIDVLTEKGGVAEALVEIVDTTVGGLFKPQIDDLTDIYATLEEAVYDENSTYDTIQVIPPLASYQLSETDHIDLNDNVKYETNRSEYGTTLEKYFESVMSQEDGDLTSIKKRYPNANSILVLLQHMMDAAIMYDSLGEALYDFPDYTGGFMLNHDSIGATTELAMNIEHHYKRSTMKLNAEVDFVEIALRELRFARSQTYANAAEVEAADNVLKAQRLKLEDKMEALADDVRDERQSVNPIEVEGDTVNTLRPEDSTKTKEMLREIGLLHADVKAIDKKRTRLKTVPLNEKLAERMDKQIKKIETVLPAQIEAKQELLKDAVIDTAFGVKPKLLEESKKLDLKSYKGKGGTTPTSEATPSFSAAESLEGLQELIDTGPEKVLSYDLETSGIDPQTADIMQIGYKVGTDKAQNINIRLTQTSAKAYLDAMRKSGNKDLVKTKLFKDILKSWRAKDGMKAWNKNAVPLTEALTMFEGMVEKSEAVVSFNGKLYDDVVMEAHGTDVETTHDMRNLAQDSVLVLKGRKGKLSDLTGSTEDAHNADIDTQMTFDLANKRGKPGKSNPQPTSVGAVVTPKTTQDWINEGKNLLKRVKSLEDLDILFQDYVDEAQKLPEKAQKEIQEALEPLMTKFMDQITAALDARSDKEGILDPDVEKLLAKQFDFTPAEMIKLKERFGEDTLARMFQNIEAIKTTISLTPVTKVNPLAEFAAQYLPFLDSIHIPDKLTRDVRQMKIPTGDLLAETDSAVQAAIVTQAFGEVKKLEGFEQKVAFLEILAHEADHATNYSFLEEYMRVSDEVKQSAKYREVRYIEREMKRLRKILAPRFKDLNNMTTVEQRLHYALYGPSADHNTEIDLISMLEFTAVMRNEPEFATAMYEAAYPEKSEAWISKALTALYDIIDKLLNKISNNREELTQKNLNQMSTLFAGTSKTPSKKSLQQALDIAHFKAMMTETNDKPSEAQVLGFINVIEDNYKPYKPKDTDKKGVIEESSNIMVAIDKKAADVIQNTIDLTQDVTVRSSKAKDLHADLMKSSKIYRDTFNAVTDQWDNNTFIGKLKFYLDLDPNARRAEFNKLNTQAIHAEERKNQFETDKMNSLYKKIDGLFTKAETKTLYKFLAEVPVGNLGKGNYLSDIMKGKKSIEEAIEEVIAGYPAHPKATAKLVAKAKELAGLYMDKEATKGIRTDANLSTSERELVGQLSALYSMQKVPNLDSLIKKTMSGKKHKAVVNDLLELVSAIKTLDDELYDTITLEIDKHIGNFNKQIFDSNLEVKAVSLNSINKALRDDLGWKVLRHPTTNQAGILYRDGGDITFQGGLGTSAKLNDNLSIEISGKYSATANNAIPQVHSDMQTVVLTNEELETLGMIQDPIPSLVKAYSHRMFLQETQAIREEIINEFTYDYKNGNTERKIVNDIKKGEHLWYISLPDGVTIDQLDPLIQQKYKATRASSDVEGFADTVTLVRKDMADFVEGYKEIQVGGVGTKLNKAFSILKKMVLLQKIHWIIVAPAKVTLDAISNAAYLMSRNIPITTMYTKTKRISNDMAEFTKIREDLLHAEFRNRAKPSKAGKKRIELLETKIKNHRMASAYFRGFIQSIAIDLTQKNEHTAAGLHKDIGGLIDKIFKNDQGSLNTAGKFIMDVSKWGINGEDLLLKVAAYVEAKGESNVAQATAQTLTEIGNHIKTMKNKDDIAQYLQEYMATPGSALVTVGSVAVQTPDVISKVILQEFLVETAVREYKRDNKGRGPDKATLQQMNEDASIEAVTSFIDYKMNIPRELRFLEQTGITSFISFWARIQKVMLVSLRNNPVNALITILINEMLNLGGGTIFDASLIDKWGSGSLIGGPTPGMDVVLPTKLFG